MGFLFLLMWFMDLKNYDFCIIWGGILQMVKYGNRKHVLLSFLNFFIKGMSVNYVTKKIYFVNSASSCRRCG